MTPRLFADEAEVPPRILSIFLLGAAAAHVAEESLFGWVAYTRQFVPDVSNNLFVLGNAAFLVLVSIGVGVRNVTFRLSLLALVLWNVPFHLGPSLATGRFSPGLLTALVLYLPLGGYAMATAIQSREISRGVIVRAAVAGAILMAVPLLAQLGARSLLHG